MRNVLFSLVLAVPVVAAESAPASLDRQALDRCVADGILSDAQRTDLAGAQAARANYRTELQRAAAHCRAHHEALASAGQAPLPVRGPQSAGERQMMAGGAQTPHAEYRTSRARLEQKQSRRAKDADAAADGRGE